MGEAVPVDGVWVAITGGERGRILVLGLGLAIALVGLFLVAVVLSHRVAGPAVALAATCRRVGAGDLSAPRPLRRRDMLVDLAEEVSLMVEELREREVEERALLADAALRIRRSASLHGGHEIAARLEELASRKGERLGPAA
jgi:methyl-accepting chemotaxis protein